MPRKIVKITESEAERLARLTFLLARACEDKEQYFIKLYNLTSAEFRLLRFLKSQTAINAKELSFQVGVSQGRITQILTTLEKKGYITRELDFSDRRNILIKLTEEAIPFVQNVSQKHIELHTKVLEKIPTEIRDTVLEAIEELLMTLSSWSKEKPNAKEFEKEKNN